MDLFKFHLEKIYLDCIDPQGNCFVVYWAKLQVCFLKITYSGLLYSNVKNIIKERSSFRATIKPSTEHEIHFNNRYLKIKGSWENLNQPLTLLLYTDSHGKELKWCCHHPKTNTHITFEGKEFYGYGYAETLILPIKPWVLPIDELHWGRFLSEKFSIIWIHWKGSNPINKIFCNNSLYEDGIFEEDKIVFDNAGFVLHFGEISMLRKGKLSGILAKMPWLKILFNKRFLNSVENKYKSKTTFMKDGNVVDRGWSLYEIVSWIK